jgi:hypothetical protein
VEVTVTLDNRHHLVVSPGRPSLFTLDFNLAATNSVNLATSPATVTVTPALVASLDFVDQKDLRVRGPRREAFRKRAAANPATKSPPKTTSGLRRANPSRSSSISIPSLSRR